MLFTSPGPEYEKYRLILNTVNDLLGTTFEQFPFELPFLARPSNARALLESLREKFGVEEDGAEGYQAVAQNISAYDGDIFEVVLMQCFRHALAAPLRRRVGGSHRQRGGP